MCDFEGCTESGVRHFFGNHFCSEHNEYLRELIQDVDPDDAIEWVNGFTS